MPTIGELVLELSADVKGLRQDLAEAQAATKGYSKKTETSLKRAGAAFTKYGALGATALAGIAVAAIKSAGKFEKSMQDVSTLISGDATKAIEGLEKGIRQLSRDLPKTPNDLGASAYDIFSAGITDTSDALNVLRQSAKLGIAGLGTQAASVDIMTSAINAFGLEAEDAEEVANILFTTVKVGKTTVDAMASQFGNVASQAAAAGVSLSDMQAQLAALTAVGVPTRQAQTRLAQAYIQSTKAGTKFEKAMNKAGTTMAEFRDGIKKKGFVKAIEDVRDSMRKKGETMEELNTRFKGLFESSEAQGVLFSLLTAAGPAYVKAFEEMGKGTKDFNDAVEKNTQGFEQSKERLKSAWQNLAIAFGKTGTLDAAADSISTLSEVLLGLADNIEEQESVVGGVGKSITGTFKEIARTVGESEFAPIAMQKWAAEYIETLDQAEAATGATAQTLKAEAEPMVAPIKAVAEAFQGMEKETGISKETMDSFIRKLDEVKSPQGLTDLIQQYPDVIGGLQAIQQELGAVPESMAFDKVTSEIGKVELEVQTLDDSLQDIGEDVRIPPVEIPIEDISKEELAFIDDMTAKIDADMKTGLEKVKATTAAENKNIADSFKTDLANPVVLESTVPDMIDAIGEQFQRLEDEMGTPTKAATESVVNMFEAMATAFEGFSGAIGTGDVSFSDLVGEFGDLSDAVTSLGETAPTLTEQWSMMTSTVMTTTADMTAQSSASAMDMQGQVSSAMQQMVSQSSSVIDRLIQRLRQLQEEFRQTAREARKMADSVSVKSSLPEMQEKGSPPVKELGEDLQGLTEDMDAVTRAGKKMEQLAGGAGVTPDLPIPAIDDPRKRNAASQAFNDSKARARATVDMIKNIEAARLDLLDTEGRAFEEERIRWAEEQARFEENFALMTKENQVRAEQMGFREDLEAAHLARLAELNTEFRLTDKELWSAYWMEVVENETSWLDVATSTLEEFTQGWTDIVAQGIADAAAGVKGGSQTMIAAFGALFGGIAKTIGEFFIAEGLAKVAAAIFPPNAQLAASGAGEIAAGLGLKALGAILGGQGKGGGASKGAGGGAAATPTTPGIGDFGRGEEDPFQRGEASVVLDIGRLASDPRIATDIAGLTRRVVTELYNQRGMNVEIEVTTN